MKKSLKRWLSIDELERENLTIAKALVAERARIDGLKARIEQLEAENSLTSEPAKPKIVPKQRVNWKNFRSAAEKASEPEREEA